MLGSIRALLWQFFHKLGRDLARPELNLISHRLWRTVGFLGFTFQFVATDPNAAGTGFLGFTPVPAVSFSGEAICGGSKVSTGQLAV
jgi:hypothetical protein